MNLYRLLTPIFAVALLTTATKLSAADFSAADLEFFERRVRPLLDQHCYQCHSGRAETIEAGLRLDFRDAILAGGETEPAVVPGKPAESLLVSAVEYGDLYQMPPEGKLPDEAVAVLREWVRRGAPWPAGETGVGENEVEQFDLEGRRRAHWSWQPLVDFPPPEVQNTRWPLDPLDRFVLARLETAGIAPAPPANPQAVLRRVYFDLIGLPPPPERVAAFAADPSQSQLLQIVDDLLSSRQFGERWARHWLDLMRYADTRGHEFDNPTPNAWQYRDYVVRAINADVPYDEFVLEHIAGDLLDPPRTHPQRGFNESILATGFWYLGDWVHSPVDIRKDECDRIDNAIDVFGKAFLGLTVACARCHDHKFDAISQRDYYALAGYLQSSGYQQTRFESREQNRRVAHSYDQLRRETGSRLAELLKDPLQAQVEGLPGRLAAAAEKAAGSTAGDAAATSWSAELGRAAAEVEHPLHYLARAAAAGFPAVQRELAGYRGADRALPTQQQIVVDYDQPGATWLTDGPAFGDAPLARGEVLPGDDSASPICEVVVRGRATLRAKLSQQLDPAQGALDPGKVEEWGDRSSRILRTPGFVAEGGKLYYLMRGAARVQVVMDSHRLIAGPLYNETFKQIAFDDAWRWVEHDLSPHIGHGMHVEFSPLDEHPLEVSMVVDGVAAPPLPPTWSTQIAAAAIEQAGSLEEFAVRLGRRLVEASDAFAAGSHALTPADCYLADWLVRRVVNSANTNVQLNEVVASHRREAAGIAGDLKATSALAPTIWDGSAQDQQLLVRGNPRVAADFVPRRFLTALAGDDQQATKVGSGRLELAERLLDVDNPLPARVIVNRIWHHLTGRGIVPSVDNFGVLGEPPTHPQLLDYLAHRMRGEGWSLKKMVRTIVSSRTYQMSSRIDARAEAADPANRLLHRMPVRRLQGEVIRDTILSLSGRMDPKSFGPAVPVHLTPFMEGRGRPQQSGPLDGDGRRSIYIGVRRNFLSPMMLAFDTPQPAGPVGRRTVSNVPAQALILMNDPLVVEQAALYAERLLAAEATDEARIRRLYLESLSRAATGDEVDRARRFLTDQRAAGDGEPADDEAERAVWADLCHVMFNVKEFIYLE